ncbi:MAG: CofH family radical SAM protein [Candidatus Methylacidiphilales bacterium]|nr:CofH family radical SAM protein [Candidatus Methylacidiphilales bacterium]
MREDPWDLSLPELQAEAARLNNRRHGNRVTYVVNRNANFTNICTVGCSFCGFQRKASDADAYDRTAGEVIERLSLTPWVTEVCLQGGIHPGWRLEDYAALVRSIKEHFPGIHVHAFSPMEIEHMRRSSGRDLESVLGELIDSGLDTMPGTAAEILVDRVRGELSGNKLGAATWEQIVRTAHGMGLKSTATVMYGHIETWEDIREHFSILQRIQEDTGGFTELVPLAFIPYRNRLGSRMVPGRVESRDFAGFEQRSMERAQRLYPLARVYFDHLIPNLQTSWVKLGPARAVASLDWGCNDFGGTLYEESITRESGGAHGECLTPGEIRRLLLAAGWEPAERSTTYRLLPRREVPETRAPGLAAVV